MRRAFIFVLILFCSLGAKAADVTPPDRLVHEATDHILALIKKNHDVYAADHAKLYAMVDREVLPYFDFRVIARQVLARYWRQANEDQRQRFTQEFRELLVRTYATALLKYTNEEIRYLPVFAKPDDKRVLVRTEVVQGHGSPNIPLYYSFYLSPDGWKIYNVKIDTLDLVITYRNTYHDEISRRGLDAVIAGLAEDNRRAREHGQASRK